MHYEWLDAYLLSFPGVEKDYQPVWQWFRYKVRGRLFAAVCSPGPEYKIYGGHDLVNLKCGAAEIAKLEKEMREASKMLEFEYAAVLRDRIIELRGEK